MAERPRVLILGAGFAGLGAADKLKKAPVDIVLFDKNAYSTFQPLLYQVATSMLDPETVGQPIRDTLRDHDNLTFHQTAVSQVDLGRQIVHCEDMPSQEYDHLIIALGAKVNFFGVTGAAEFAFPLYTLKDAVELKRHILQQFETVDRDPSLLNEGALNFVIVGGGPTGVEMTGALTGFFKELTKDYPNIAVEKARVIMIDGQPAPLRMFKENLQVYAQEALEARGAELMLGQHVAEITPTHVVLKSGDIVKTHTLIWAGGLQANPLVESLGLELARGGRIPVGPNLSPADHPSVQVVGDIAMIDDGHTALPLPQLGSVAAQSGQHAGQNIARMLDGKKPKPFKYLDKGTMATIARGAAVLQPPRGPTLHGELAWLSWGALHLAMLSGGGRGASALVSYGFTAVTGKRSSRITID